MERIFLYLLAAHLIGDWLIQTQWMASQKTKSWWALLAHVGSYHLFSFAALLLAGVNLISALWATAFLAATHAFLDRREFEIWWVKRIKKMPDVPYWILICVDQSFHLILIILVSFWVS